MINIDLTVYSTSKAFILDGLKKQQKKNSYTKPINIQNISKSYISDSFNKTQQGKYT